MLLAKALDDLSKKYDNVILLDGFNIEPEENNKSNFLSTCNLKKYCQTKWPVSDIQIDQPVSI